MSKLTIAQLTELVEAQADAIDALTARLDAYESQAPKRKVLESKRKMTKEDAYRILPGGDLADVSHNDVAEQLELSYGQVYSCRKEHTFKDVHYDLAKQAKAANG